MVVLLAEEVAAQGPRLPTRRSGSGSGSTVTKYYVLIEKTGIEIYCGLYSSIDEVKQRGELVIAENKVRKEANEVLDTEIKGLREQIATKSRELQKAEDEDSKSALTKEIEALKQQIAEKEQTRQTLIKLIGPAEFRTRKAAENYMEKKYAAADKIKEELDDKERAEAKKTREEARKKAEEARKKAAEEAEKKAAEQEKDEEEKA